MQKKHQRRRSKLRLSRQTLRKLSTDELAVVAGASNHLTCATESCGGSCDGGGTCTGGSMGQCATDNC